MSVFFRALEYIDKEAALRRAICQEPADHGKLWFRVNAKNFSLIPGSPFAYWVGECIRSIYEKWPTLGTSGHSVKQGLSTANDFRFVRAAWEVSLNKKNNKWLHFAKGGKFSPFYSDIYLLVNWDDSGYEVKNFISMETGKALSFARSDDFYCRIGLTWPRRTKSPLAMRVLPQGSVFADKGPALFSATDEESELLAIFAVSQSCIFGSLVEVQLAAADARRGGAARSYEVGIIQQTPFPPLGNDDKSNLASLSLRAWHAKYKLDSVNETSAAFLLPLPLARCIAGFNSSELENRVASILEEIEEHAYRIYQLDSKDRKIIAEWSQKDIIDGPSAIVDDSEDFEDDDDASEGNYNELGALLSWAVGLPLVALIFDLPLVNGISLLTPAHLIRLQNTALVCGTPMTLFFLEVGLQRTKLFSSWSTTVNTLCTAMYLTLLGA